MTKRIFPFGPFMYIIDQFSNAGLSKVCSKMGTYAKHSNNCQYCIREIFEESWSRIRRYTDFMFHNKEATPKKTSGFRTLNDSYPPEYHEALEISSCSKPLKGHALNLVFHFIC